MPLNYCDYLVNVITFNLTQSDHIKRLFLYHKCLYSYVLLSDQFCGAKSCFADKLQTWR